MAKTKVVYSCQHCGWNSPKWLGKCNACDAWNSLVEEMQTPTGGDADGGSLADVREELRGMRSPAVGDVPGVHWVKLSIDVSGDASSGPGKEQGLKRLTTGISELDRVLGGGLVPDSFTLLGGDPGIGKSTLLLQMAQGLCLKHSELKVLYVSGEESVDQIRGRAHRLGMEAHAQIFLAAETQLEKVFTVIKELRPHVVVMDSLQTFSTGVVQAAPGSVSQLREVAARLMTLAKSAGIAVWLVGHVTKEGNIAGPKMVEHMVDTVLYFEGEGGYSYRLLRTVKNRFGSTRELGVFEMDGEGLRQVSNPSALFLSERKTPVPGTAVAVTLEGSRPLLVELQALVTSSGLAMPRRTSVGIDATRISLLAAILEKHMKLSLAEKDLFFNVAGGLKLSEPACDLAAAAAIWSSMKEFALPASWTFVGELGLTGEIRRVSQLEMRIQEAHRLGFRVMVVPAQTPQVQLDTLAKKLSMKLLPVDRIGQLPQCVSHSSSGRVHG